LIGSSLAYFAIAIPMAQHSSNSSGLGTLLARGLMGIFSITATAVVSTMVQRYLADAPAVPNLPSTTLSPGTSPSGTLPSGTLSPATASSSPVPEVIDAEAPASIEPVFSESEAQPSDWASDAATSDSPIIVPAEADLAAPVETQVPANSDQIAEQSFEQPIEATASEDEHRLREQLNDTLQEKWNK
jgi:hypothetical protein